MISSPVKVIIDYWKDKGPEKENLGLILYDKYLALKSKNDSPLLFLLEMEAKYPDAPDILLWLGKEWEEEHEYLKALQTYIKLIKLYPEVEHYKLELKSCKTFIEFRSVLSNEKWPGFGGVGCPF